ncbi:uncharacterized protein LOC129882356 [Solanum dulcamara]|uniref:uncharacterized protein LOC129882356 n=1 Tax=Solanum dulcamara TaxID=45834 RepID=UPI002485E944|nr:uncharacterized protein LOC129882356 [Solanum dulcamara]
MNFRSMEEFWPYYMNHHSKPATRRWHFAVLGYGLAWYSHFFVEGNVPATFRHPFWSLLCDFKMFGLMLTGQMDREIKRLGKRPVLQVY